MSKCSNCGIELKDPAAVCPLCRCIVESDGEPAEATYPRAEKGIQKIQRALNIYTFAAIVAEIILVWINYAAKGSFGWVIIVAGLFVYGFVTLKVSIQMHTGYRLKMILQTLLGVAVLLLIDTQTGFYGWSLQYVLPAAFILMDVAIIVLMIVNNRNWQSYLPMQLLVIALCFIPFVLNYFHMPSHLLMAFIAMAVAILTFVGSMIVGGKRARDEMFRRFHV